MKYVGYITLEANDENIKVFFDDDDVTSMLDNGFIVFDRLKDSKVIYLLINTGSGPIRYINYEEDKNK
jgi:hypothetical protein